MKIYQALLPLPSDIYKDAIVNILNDGGDLNEETYLSIRVILVCMFTWHTSPQGQEYWEKIADQYTNPLTKLK